jgi:hypothetical protein
MGGKLEVDSCLKEQDSTGVERGDSSKNIRAYKYGETRKLTSSPFGVSLLMLSCTVMAAKKLPSKL